MFFLPSVQVVQGVPSGRTGVGLRQIPPDILHAGHRHSGWQPCSWKGGMDVLEKTLHLISTKKRKGKQWTGKCLLKTITNLQQRVDKDTAISDAPPRWLPSTPGSRSPYPQPAYSSTWRRDSPRCTDVEPPRSARRSCWRSSGSWPEAGLHPPRSAGQLSHAWEHRITARWDPCTLERLESGMLCYFGEKLRKIFLYGTSFVQVPPRKCAWSSTISYIHQRSVSPSNRRVYTKFYQCVVL